MTTIEAIKQALDALEYYGKTFSREDGKMTKAQKAAHNLRAAFMEIKDVEPYAYIADNGSLELCHEGDRARQHLLYLYPSTRVQQLEHRIQRAKARALGNIDGYDETRGHDAAWMEIVSILEGEP